MNREMLAAADATEGAVNVMDAEEQRLVSERQSREGASFSVIAGVLLTGLFLAFVFFLIHHQMIMDQVRERLRAEIAQRNLSARLLNLQDEEARRFARELHDSVGQHLAAIKMGVAIPSGDSRPTPSSRTVLRWPTMRSARVAPSLIFSIHPFWMKPALTPQFVGSSRASQSAAEYI